MMRRFWLALASSVLLPLALPNELFHNGQPVIGVVALVPLFVAFREASTRREAVRIGVVFAVVSTFLANYWLMFFGEFSVWTITGVIAGYVLFHLLTAPILHAACSAPRRWRPFLIAMIWTCYEYLTSIGYLGYPWGLIAYPVSGILPLVQHVDITGVWSLTFLVATVNAVLAELDEGRDSTDGHDRMPAAFIPVGTRRSSLTLRQAGVVLVLSACALIYGSIRLSVPIPTPLTVDAVLVQQNADSWAFGGHEEALRTAQRLTRAGIEAEEGPPDIAVWSETSLRYPYRENRRYYESRPEGDPFIEFIGEIETPLLTGNHYVLDWDARESLNAAILIAPNTEIVDFYGKQHPVPFAEHVPFWEVPAVRRFFREVVGLQAIWVPGGRYTVFSIENAAGQTVRFGTPICFEDSFAYLGRGFVLRGADLLINLTNNSWSRTDSAQIQHYVAARFRAIENRRTLVRSTNSGLTTVVDAYGRRLTELPMFEEGFLRIDIPVYRTRSLTAYTVLGDYLPILMIGILLSVAVAFAVRRHAGARA